MFTEKSGISLKKQTTHHNYYIYDNYFRNKRFEENIPVFNYCILNVSSHLFIHTLGFLSFINERNTNRKKVLNLSSKNKYIYHMLYLCAVFSCWMSTSSYHSTILMAGPGNKVSRFVIRATSGTSSHWSFFWFHIHTTTRVRKHQNQVSQGRCLLDFCCMFFW